jgi:hypothetical protein
MKTLKVLPAILSSLFLCAQNSQTAKPFKGEIADSSCAYNVHSLTRSHQEMLKTKDAGADPSSCARHCIKHMGAHYVLVQKGEVYRLADQPDSAIDPLAGKIVTVYGNLDRKTNTIHVSAINQ